MNITYVLLSPTFGMHQYTADLANRVEGCRFAGEADQALNQESSTFNLEPSTVSLVTTTTLPRDRYSPAVQVQAPVTTHGTGFSREGLNLAAYRRVHSLLVTRYSSLVNLQPSTLRPAQGRLCNLQPAIVHFTGVHAWNVPLVYSLRRRGVPVIHSLHDLEPHAGVRRGRLIRLWNRLIVASGCHLLVHGERYRRQLLDAGVPAERITCTPLLHGFLGAGRPWPPEPGLNCDRNRSVLFFGRVEAYKGVDTLLTAWERANIPIYQGTKYQGTNYQGTLTIAGPGATGMTLSPLPPGVELRDRRIMDDEGDALFRSAGLLVLPYRDATQSALVAAAYAYGVPVVVTRAGALPEYVVEGETGWVVPPGDPATLAAALREALSDPARLAAMGAAGRRWFEAQRRDEERALSEMYGQAVEG